MLIFKISKKKIYEGQSGQLLNNFYRNAIVFTLNGMGCGSFGSNDDIEKSIKVL